MALLDPPISRMSNLASITGGRPSGVNVNAIEMMLSRAFGVHDAVSKKEDKGLATMCHNTQAAGGEICDWYQTKYTTERLY